MYTSDRDIRTILYVLSCMVDGMGGVQKKILSLSEFGYEAEIEPDPYSLYE